MEKKLTFGSLFAGIGGFDLGLERAGLICKWQVEIDKFCLSVLEKHWPHVKKFRDIRSLKSNELETVDLICGGFPCQPYSYAGVRRGNNDDRALWPEMFRIIREKRPTWVICENVAGFASLGLKKTILDLESIKYQSQTFIIPAVAFNTSHQRNRVWIVSHANTKRLAKRKSKRSKEPKLLPIERLSFERVRNAISYSQYHRGNDLFPRGMDEIKALGNSVLPQIPEIIGQCILEIEQNGV